VWASGATPGYTRDGVNQTRRRKPGKTRTGSLRVGWAWPRHERIMYNRASAERDGKPWSEAKEVNRWEETGNTHLFSPPVPIQVERPRRPPTPGRQAAVYVPTEEPRV